MKSLRAAWQRTNAINQLLQAKRPLARPAWIRSRSSSKRVLGAPGMGKACAHGARRRTGQGAHGQHTSCKHVGFK
eukprot:2839619-Pyramimonas_sp.AAC.2